jgi:molybdate transport system ATP-binding protein/molybdate transport system permease protein
VASRAWRGGAFHLLGGLLALYLAAPVVAFLVRLATSSNEGFDQAGLFSALYTSALAATISTALIALLGIPLAYLLARSRSRFAALIGVIVQLPLALPPLMSGILLIYVVGPYTALGSFFNGNLTDSLVGIVLAQSFVASPFLVVVARASFAAIDPALFDLAAGLGRRAPARFWLVALPAAAGGIRAGLLLAWLRAFGEYGATVILAFHPYSLPVFTYLQFSESGVSTTVAPTALALALAAIVVLLARLRHRPRRRAVHRLPAPITPPPVRGAPVAFDLELALGTFHLGVAHEGESSQLAILGPSGSGKTATLRAIAGLFGPHAGPVRYGAEDVSATPIEERGIGYLPQGGGLFPHLTVWRQLLFGAGADAGLAAYWLSRLGLEGLENRFPGELSGGQRQRVGLAAALSRAPRLLLLDEPFSALDAPVRDELRRELRALQRETGVSTVVVTHDPQEAALLAEELVVIVDGGVVQAGGRRDVFSRPASPQIARLLGIANLFPGVVSAGGRGIACGELELEAAVAELPPGQAIWWCVRPEDVHVSELGPIEALVVEVADLGVVSEITLHLGGDLLLRGRDAHLPQLRSGERCRLALSPEAIGVWPRPS